MHILSRLQCLFMPFMFISSEVSFWGFKAILGIINKKKKSAKKTYVKFYFDFLK